jgi:hypothetical protein
MFPQNINAFNNPYGYGQLTPYTASAPYQAAKSGTAAGGNTLLIITGIIATGILIGMALGLGLGIGAAGIITSINLINVTNTTGNT